MIKPKVEVRIHRANNEWLSVYQSQNHFLMAIEANSWEDLEKLCSSVQTALMQAWNEVRKEKASGAV